MANWYASSSFYENERQESTTKYLLRCVICQLAFFGALKSSYILMKEIISHLTLVESAFHFRLMINQLSRVQSMWPVSFARRRAMKKRCYKNKYYLMRSCIAEVSIKRLKPRQFSYPNWLLI